MPAKYLLNEWTILLWSYRNSISKWIRWENPVFTILILISKHIFSYKKCPIPLNVLEYFFTVTSNALERKVRDCQNLKSFTNYLPRNCASGLLCSEDKVKCSSIEMSLLYMCKHVWDKCIYSLLGIIFINFLPL